MGRRTRRYGFGALGATMLAASAIAAPLIESGPAWGPVKQNLDAAPAEILPAIVDDANPVGVVRTTLDEAGRPVITKETTTSRAKAEDLVRDAQRAPRAVSVGVDVPVYALGVPSGNDPYRAQMWNLPKIKTTDSWTASTGSGVVVAVLDTGVQANHPDLTGKVLSGRNEVAGTTGVSSDVHGHGTHVAGTIAAATGNNIGITGVAPDTKILPVKVLGDNGSGWSSDIAQGIIWSADNGADVINMSLGGGKDPAQTNAIAYARSKGVVVVAAAGNSRQQGSPVAYPAADPGVIAVAATDNADGYASFSNTGSYVDIAAPGVGIWSTVPAAKGNYAAWNGTSMASPHVAALAALLLGKNSGLTPDQVEQAITSSAADLGAKGKDNDYGYGRIDAVAALAKVSGGTPAPPVTPPALPTPEISSDGQSATVLYGTALKTTFSVRKNGAAWPKLAVQLCTADNGAAAFKCKKLTTDKAGAVVHSRKATAQQRFKLVVAAGKVNAAAEGAVYETQLRSTVALTAKKSKKDATLTAKLVGAAKQTVELQSSADGQTWKSVRTVKASSSITMTKVPFGAHYRVVVPDITTVQGSTSNPVQV